MTGQSYKAITYKASTPQPFFGIILQNEPLEQIHVILQDKNPEIHPYVYEWQYW